MNKEVAMVASKYFGFVEKPNCSIVIDDGINYLTREGKEMKLIKWISGVGISGVCDFGC